MATVVEEGVTGEGRYIIRIVEKNYRKSRDNLSEGEGAAPAHQIKRQT